MTENTKKLIAEFETELEELPEEAQEKYVASFLRDLRRRKRQKEKHQNEEGQAGQEKGELYEPFRIMLDADLDLPSDYSETYEEHLYGTEKHND